MVNITFMNIFPSEAFYVFHIHYLFELKHSLKQQIFIIRDALIQTS